MYHRHIPIPASLAMYQLPDVHFTTTHVCSLPSVVHLFDTATGKELGEPLRHQVWSLYALALYVVSLTTDCWHYTQEHESHCGLNFTHCICISTHMYNTHTHTHSHTHNTHTTHTQTHMQLDIVSLALSHAGPTPQRLLALLDRNHDLHLTLVRGGGGGTRRTVSLGEIVCITPTVFE